MTLKKIKVLIIGAEGYIRPHLTEALAKERTKIRNYIIYNGNRDI